jgi:NAD(P)H-quinone oxidoreductase subunit 4
MPALVLAGIIFVLGIQPAWLLKWSESTTNAIVSTLPADRNAQVAINYPVEHLAISIASTQQTKSADPH